MTVYIEQVILLSLTVIVLNASEKYAKVKCNPENRHLFGKFLLQRWSDARKEIGFFVDPFATRMYQSLENAQMLKVRIETNLSSLSYNCTRMCFYQYIKLVDHVMNTVNSFTPGAKVYYNIEVPVPYIPILSCIEKNIMVRERLHTCIYIFSIIDWTQITEKFGYDYVSF